MAQESSSVGPIDLSGPEGRNAVAAPRGSAPLLGPKPGRLTRARVARAVALVGDAVRLANASPEEIAAAAEVLAGALEHFPDSAPQDLRTDDAAATLRKAGVAVAAAIRRRTVALRSAQLRRGE